MNTTRPASPNADTETPARSIDELLEVMARLRDPNDGCPWDIEQNFESIAPYTIEEAYEVADAIARKDIAALKDELGDLLLQVVYHSRMAEEGGHFVFDDVASAITAKMIRRHPHVFGDAVIPDAATQTESWETIKAAERAKDAADDGGPQSVLDNVPAGLPALKRAVKLQKRAARVGFDWPSTAPVLDKVREEVQELEAEIDSQSHADRLEDELGDLLFAVVNLARKLDIDPDNALRKTNLKFEQRFGYIERMLAKEERSVTDASLDEMETLWQRAKSASAHT
jgi:ATP diphosphatase